MHEQTGLRIPPLLWHTMLAHAQAEYPLEACGLLGGTNGRVRHLYAIENQLHSPTRYQMEPAQQIQAILHLEEQGEELLAIYHSHPQGPETPSASDLAQASFPQAIYLILSLAQRDAPVVRGFYLRQGQAQEVLVRCE